MIRPAITYGCQIWAKHLNKKQINKLDSTQHKIILKCLQAYRTVPHNITSILSHTPKLSDYIQTLYRTNNIPDAGARKLAITTETKENIRSYHTQTNNTFKSFFPTPPLKFEFEFIKNYQFNH